MQEHAWRSRLHNWREFLGYFTKNDYAEFESFCATSVEWKSLHSVGEQSSFVLKIR